MVPVAQLVEQSAVNRKVAGSNPVWNANEYFPNGGFEISSNLINVLCEVG